MMKQIQLKLKHLNTINNLKYKMIDIGRLENYEIKTLYENSLITFLPRYEMKYKKMFIN